MPLTELQYELGRLLAANRSEDSYLAGGTAILIEPNTKRISQDIDYFHDSTERVATAYAADLETLRSHRFDIEPEIMMPGYIRVVVRRGEEATKVEWARDSAWRFMPVIASEEFGYQLHPIDLATNKVLALAGRDEARDLVDTLHLHRHVLPLGPLIWAAVGKDPGFSPLSLLELLRRRGRLHPEEVARLHVSEPLDLQDLKMEWLDALEGADAFVRSRPTGEAGCLYYSPGHQNFVDPNRDDVTDAVPHFGCPGGVLPRSSNQPAHGIEG
jgi:hypothetical protein